jgi:hypothetical protein
MPSTIKNLTTQCYNIFVILNALKTLLSTKQKKSKNVQDFTKKICIARDVLESHIDGPIILTKFLEETTGFEKRDESTKNSHKRKAFE